ncbi:hypothetical protein GCM10027566_25080 [Arachidicoccus ginsenosidivorans]|jgi:hypothetical protein
MFFFNGKGPSDKGRMICGSFFGAITVAFCLVNSLVIFVAISLVFFVAILMEHYYNGAIIKHNI